MINMHIFFLNKHTHGYILASKIIKILWESNFRS